MYGGPRHGKKYMVPERHVWLELKAEGGHYARRGGKKDEMFWHNFPPPFAYLQNGLLAPVKYATHNAVLSGVAKRSPT